MKLVMFVVALVVVGPAHADTKPRDSRFEIQVTKRGFEPDSITVPARTPLTLVFTRKTNMTCAKTVVVAIDESKKIERELPLDTPVEIAVTFPRAGKLGYACSMDMTKGTIVVQ